MLIIFGSHGNAASPRQTAQTDTKQSVLLGELPRLRSRGAVPQRFYIHTFCSAPVVLSFFYIHRSARNHLHIRRISESITYFEMAAASLRTLHSFSVNVLLPASRDVNALVYFIRLFFKS